MTFSVEPLDELPDVWLITPLVFPDERGEFLETYQADKFREIGLDVDFVQDNQSVSRRGVLRGLHYQVPPHAQAKLLRATAGSIFDVVVDMRQSSSTFGKWTGRELSGAGHQMFWIPEGFAHGFLTTSDSAVVVYKTTEVYSADAERTISWSDADIGIEWPDVGVGPNLSAKDAAAASFADADKFP